MRCISPMSVKTGEVYNTVPCGNCGPCLSNKRNDWTFRLSEEQRQSKTSYFLTLTYGEKYVVRERFGNHKFEVLHKADLQAFIKRLREAQRRAISKIKSQPNCPVRYLNWPNLRYYAIGEYGPTGYRPHYHILLFNLFPTLSNKLQKYWDKGFIDEQNMSTGNIHYVTGYFVTAGSEDSQMRLREELQPRFTIMSTKPGIGYEYLDRAKQFHRDNLEFRVTFNNGIKKMMPRYYKDKIFNDDEKEQFAEHCQDEAEKQFYEDYAKRESQGDNYFVAEDLRKKGTQRIITKSTKRSKL